MYLPLGVQVWEQVVHGREMMALERPESTASVRLNAHTRNLLLLCILTASERPSVRLVQSALEPLVRLPPELPPPGGADDHKLAL